MSIIKIGGPGFDPLAFATKGNTGGGVASPSAGGASPSAGGGGAASKVDNKQKDAVRAMQRMLNDLATKMINNPGNICKIIGFKEDEKNKKYIVGIGSKINTSWAHGGGVTGTAFDGTWGSATDKSLADLRDFIKRASTVNNSLVKTKLSGIIIISGVNYSKESSDKVIESAEANMTNIRKIFSVFEMQPQGGGEYDKSAAIFDSLPKDLLSANKTDPASLFQGGATLRAKDLQNPYNFVRWLITYQLVLTGGACKTQVPVKKQTAQVPAAGAKQTSGPMTAEDARAASAKIDTAQANDGKFASLAKMILDSTIVRLGRPASGAPPPRDDRLVNNNKDFPQWSTQDTRKSQEQKGSAPATQPQQEKKGSAPATQPQQAETEQKDCICIEIITKAIQVLDVRSRARVDYLTENKGLQHPGYKEQRGITSDDITAAKAYEAAVDRLGVEWSDTSQDLLKYLSDNGKTYACISANLIREMFRNQSRGSARRDGGGDESGRRRNRGGAGRSEGRGEGLGRNNEKGPFEASYIDFDDLADAGYLADNWNQFLTTWKNRQIERRDIMGSNWRDFGRRHLDEAKAENPNFVTGQLRELRKLMLSIYNNWKDGGGNRRNRPPRDLVRTQNEILRDWDSVIQNLANNTQA